MIGLKNSHHSFKPISSKTNHVHVFPSFFELIGFLVFCTFCLSVFLARLMNTIVSSFSVLSWKLPYGLRHLTSKTYNILFLPSELACKRHSINADLDTFFFSGRLRISSGFPGSSRSQISRQHLQVSPGLLWLIWYMCHCGQWKRTEQTQGHFQEVLLQGSHERPVELDKETLVSLVLSNFVRLHCIKTFCTMAVLRSSYINLLSSDVIVLNQILSQETSIQLCLNAMLDWDLTSNI